MAGAGPLYLTEMDGAVWYTRDDGIVHHYSHGWDTLQAKHFGPGMRYGTVRIVALPQNVDMICDVWRHKQGGRVSRLEVCSPLCCLSALSREDPRVLLSKAASFLLPGSLGGWHEFTELDLPSYQLSQISRSIDQPDRKVQLLTSHPAWKALSFVPSLRMVHVASLIGEILDPRWYVAVDGDKAGRSAKLESYLGLTPKVQAVVSETDRTDNVAVWRCRLVLSCWNLPPATHAQSPENFIWRAWAGRGGGARGDLSASKLFLRFLRHIWLDRICAMPFRGQLFVPSYFFRTRDEVDAFQSHMNSAAVP